MPRKKIYTKDEARLRNNAKQREVRANRTPEQKAIDNAKQKERYDAQRSNQSDEERLVDNAKKLNRYHENKEVILEKRHAKVTHYTAYKHLDKNGKVIYIGSGNNLRPYDFHNSRSKAWEAIFKDYNPTVEIIVKTDFKHLAVLAEHMAINIEGLDNLINERQAIDISSYAYPIN